MSITATIQDALAGELTSILQKATRKHKLTLEWKTSYWWGPFRNAAGQTVILSGKGARFDTKAAAIEAARRLGAEVSDPMDVTAIHETNPSRPTQGGARSGRSLVVYATPTLETLGQIPVTDEARTALASLPPFETNFIPAKFRKKSGSGRKPGEICWQLFDTGEPAPFILTGPVLRTAAGEPRPGN